MLPILVAAIPSSILPPDALAREEVNRTLEEIVVVGTRREGRTVTNSPVPIDVFRGEDFQNIGTSDIDDVLRTLVPAYNVERYPLNDESSLARPATLIEHSSC
jgi:iron complex outermembrane receptor protein